MCDNFNKRQTLKLYEYFYWQVRPLRYQFSNPKFLYPDQFSKFLRNRFEQKYRDVSIQNPYVEQTLPLYFSYFGMS